MVTEPADEKLAVPFKITLPVPFKEASEPYAVRLTPALRVIFSVYVPGRIKIVSPEEELVRAVAIVVCVPSEAVAETIHFAVVKVFVVNIC